MHWPIWQTIKNL